MSYYDVNYYAQVEQTVCDILNALGIQAEQDISGYGSMGWLVSFVSGERYDVYLHISRTPYFSDDQVWSKLDDNPYSHKMEVFVGAISSQMRSRVSREYTNHIVLDICNLLYMVRENPELRKRLVGVLNFSVDEFSLIQPDTRLLALKKAAPAPVEPVADLLRNWDPKSEKSAEYEQLCCRILKKLFADDLSLWREQQKSNDGLFRFDMICKIKTGNQKDFWEIAERYFHSKYIVFEFKNYSGRVTQKEIFTTVKYLYAKALRGIAILISPNGTDAHADMAIRGILREEGKLILSLSNQDLLNMLDAQEKGRIPADYLSDKLDELLIDLEK